MMNCLRCGSKIQHNTCPHCSYIIQDGSSITSLFELNVDQINVNLKIIATKLEEEKKQEAEKKKLQEWQERLEQLDQELQETDQQIQRKRQDVKKEKYPVDWNLMLYDFFTSEIGIVFIVSMTFSESKGFWGLAGRGSEILFLFLMGIPLIIFSIKSIIDDGFDIRIIGCIFFGLVILIIPIWMLVDKYEGLKELLVILMLLLIG
jgi:cation transport ATPase